MIFCQKCKKQFDDAEIDESHNVPCYLFEGNRKGQKNQADRYGRKHLCRECHREYENKLRAELRLDAYLFATNYFKEDDENSKETSG